MHRNTFLNTVFDTYILFCLLFSLYHLKAVFELWCSPRSLQLVECRQQQNVFRLCLYRILSIVQFTRFTVYSLWQRVYLMEQNMNSQRQCERGKYRSHERSFESYLVDFVNEHTNTNTVVYWKNNNKCNVNKNTASIFSVRLNLT